MVRLGAPYNREQARVGYFTQISTQVSIPKTSELA